MLLLPLLLTLATTAAASPLAARAPTPNIRITWRGQPGPIYLDVCPSGFGYSIENGNIARTQVQYRPLTPAPR